MVEVTLYSSRYCGYCMAAKRLLDGKSVAYSEINVDGQPELRREIAQRSGQRTVPQIWIGEMHVGGFTDLAALEQQGKLDALLQPA